MAHPDGLLSSSLPPAPLSFCTAGPVPRVTHLVVASCTDSWDSAQWMSGAEVPAVIAKHRTGSVDHFTSHFQGKNWQVQDLPPGVSLRGRAQQQQSVTLPATAAGRGVSYPVTSAGGNMDLGMHNQFRRKRRQSQPMRSCMCFMDGRAVSCHCQAICYGDK